MLGKTYIPRIVLRVILLALLVMLSQTDLEAGYDYNLTATLECHEWQNIPQWLAESQLEVELPHDLPADGYVFYLKRNWFWSWSRDAEDPIPGPGDMKQPRQEVILIHNEDQGSYGVIFGPGHSNYFFIHDTYDPGEKKYDFVGPDSVWSLVYQWEEIGGVIAFWTVDPGFGHPTFEPGRNVIRYGFINGASSLPGSDKDKWELVDQLGPQWYREVVIDVEEEWLPGPGKEAFTLVNKNDWYDWLPTAPIESEDDPKQLTLSFLFTTEDSEMEYRVRGRFWRDSWYPGGWTNDYENTSGGLNFPRDERVSSGEWVNSRAYLNPAPGAPRDAADYQFKEKQGWLIQPVNSISDSTTGWTELMLDRKLTGGGSYRFDITLESLDYGATGRLCLGLVEYNPDTTRWYDSRFYLMPLYEDTVTNQPSQRDTIVSLRNLPIPRDLEAKWLEFPDAKVGPNRVLTILGDRLGDAWETDANGAGYTTIYDCMPYADDSGIDHSFYPNDASQNTVSSGDGFRNLERYRGIYGLLKLQGVEPVDTLHKRLPGKKRAILTLQLEAMNYPDTYKRKKNISYFEEIVFPGAFTNINIDQLEINPYDENGDEERKYYYHDNIQYIVEYNTSSPNNHEVLVLNGYRGHHYVNSILDNLPDYEPVVATYCKNVVTKIVDINAFISRYNNTLVGRRYKIPVITSKTTGYTIKRGFVASDTSDHGIPRDVHCSFTFYKSIRDEIASRSSIADTTSAIKKNIAKVFAHEMGHSVGMIHDKNVSKPYHYCSIMIQGTYDPPPSDYHISNYRTFRLSR